MGPSQGPTQPGQGGREAGDTVSGEQASLVAPTGEPESNSSALYLGCDIEFDGGDGVTNKKDSSAKKRND